MSLLNLFNKKTKERPSPKTNEANTADKFEIYSGMRVEVTTDTGQILFVAKLMELHGKKAELHQYSEIELPEQEEPRHVKIRGYNDQIGRASCRERV